MKRLVQINHLLFPRLVKYSYTPSDFKYDRNVNRFNIAVQNIINERKKGNTKSYIEDQGDLLSILLENTFYQQEADQKIIQELVTFFFAGMKTIQVSTTNLIYYLTKHPEIKAKLLKEILPPVELVQ